MPTRRESYRRLRELKLKVIEGGHARASRIAASESKVTRRRRRRASLIIDGQRPGGIPRLRQLLTLVGFTPRPSATFVVPPRSLISESNDMTENVSTVCGVVNAHTLAVARLAAESHSPAMARPYEAIGKRLVQLRKVLGISQAEICRQIKCSTTRWSNYEVGDRQITLPIAVKLADEYGASLDWIYRGQRENLPLDLRTRLNKAA